MASSFTPQPEYGGIVEALRRALASMESFPAAYEPQGEEALRHVLVTALEGAFAGDVAAEALRGCGKTDILVRIDGRTVYVGECKVWGGKAALHDAVDQVLGYGTWRDHGLGLIVFVRGKRFRRTLTRAVAALEEHEAFLGWVEGPSEGAGDDVATLRWARLRQRADPDAEVMVAVHFAYIPTSRAERIGGGVDDIDGGIDLLLGLRESLLAPAGEPVAYRPSMGNAGGNLPPEPGSMMRYERVGPAGRIAIDAVPADEAAAQRYGPEGAIELHEGERGDRALMLIEEARHWGVGVEVAGGFGVRLDRYPPGMHGAVERLEEQDNLRLMLQPSTEGAWPVELRVATDRGEAAVAMHLRAVDPPPKGWDVAVRGHFHNVSVTLSWRGDADGPRERALSWALHPTDAVVRNRLAALDFLYAMSGTGTLHINSHSPELPSGCIELLDSPLDRDTLFDRAFFADLVTLEDWTGRRFQLPEAVPPEHLQAIAATAAGVRTGRWRARWDRVEFTITETPPDKHDDWSIDNFLLPIEGEVFGEVVALGSGRTPLHFDIEATEPWESDPSQTKLTVIPHDAAAAVVELHGLEPPTTVPGGPSSREGPSTPSSA